MQEGTQHTAPRKSSILKDVISGKVLLNVVLVRQRWYILFLFMLALTYIGLHYYMEKTVRETRRLEHELTNLRIEYTTRSSELMLMSRRSEVNRQIKQRGMTICEPQYPPKRIKID